MQVVSLIIPKQIIFNHVNAIQKLTITNPSQQKIAVKIRTNHKTALHINPTHDFVDPHGSKDILVKLMQLHQGVKLQINYTKATEQMIAKNDSKLTNVDKKDIKKQITAINVNHVKITNMTEQKSKQTITSDQLNSSFATVVPQKSIQITKTVQKKTSLLSSISSFKDNQPTIVAQQKQEQEIQELEDKKKKLSGDLKQVQNKIQEKRIEILGKKQQLSAATIYYSFIPPATLPIIIVASYLVGSLIKSILY